MESPVLLSMINGHALCTGAPAAAPAADATGHGERNIGRSCAADGAPKGHACEEGGGCGGRSQACRSGGRQGGQRAAQQRQHRRVSQPRATHALHWMSGEMCLESNMGQNGTVSELAVWGGVIGYYSCIQWM